jgi:ABC-type sugar transport system substrate-binding protein
MRKIAMFILALVIVYVLVSCGSKNLTNSSSTQIVEKTAVDYSILPANWRNDEIVQPEWSGKEPPPKVTQGKVRIGWCPPQMTPYYDLAQRGVNEAVAEIGADKIEVVVQAPSSHASGGQEQVNILENWVSQNFTAIIVSAVDDGMLVPVFQSAAQKGIPIIEFNMPLELTQNDYFVSNVGNSAYQAGYSMGKWLKDNYQGDFAKIAVIEGLPGLHTDLRLDSFKDAIAGDPRFQIVASQPADWSRDKAASVTENILTAHPDVKVIYTLYDDMSLGAIAVIKSRGLSGITVMGYDMTPEGLEAIKSGDQAASVYTGCKMMGYNSVIAAYKYAVQGIMIPKTIFDKPHVIDKTNANTFVDF